MQREQMRIVGHQENTIAEHRHAAIRAFGRIARHILRSLPLIVPDRASRSRIQREYLIGPCHKHHAVHHNRSCFQREMIDREDPFLQPDSSRSTR